MLPSNHHYSCDYCHEPLIGGGASRDYISLKGSISLQLRDEHTGRRYWIGVSNSPDKPINFCDLVCLQDFIDMKEKIYRDGRTARLRDIASGNVIASPYAASR